MSNLVTAHEITNNQIEIDKTIEEFYDFFVDYQDLNSENKETLNLIMRRLLEVQANEEAE